MRLESTWISSMPWRRILKCMLKSPLTSSNIWSMPQKTDLDYKSPLICNQSSPWLLHFLFNGREKLTINQSFEQSLVDNIDWCLYVYRTMKWTSMTVLVVWGTSILQEQQTSFLYVCLFAFLDLSIYLLSIDIFNGLLLLQGTPEHFSLRL